MYYKRYKIDLMTKKKRDEKERNHRKEEKKKWQFQISLDGISKKLTFIDKKNLL